MLFHHADEHLSGQVLKIARVEAAQHRGRSFHQITDLIQQGGVFRQCRADPFRQGERLFPDKLPALFGIEDNALRLQIKRIIGRGLEHFFGFLCEAQSARHPPGPELCVRERHDRLAKHRHQPADRAREAHAAVIPAHGFSEAQVRNDFRQSFSQNFN